MSEVIGIADPIGLVRALRVIDWIAPAGNA
jgi:hypothetical protein